MKLRSIDFVTFLFFATKLQKSSDFAPLIPKNIFDALVQMLSAQLLVLCATLLGVEGYYEKMRDLIKK